jgi:nitrogen fixation protein NifU and related proteins
MTEARALDSLDDLRELYQAVILDHSRHPRHFGKLAGATAQARGYNPLCGDQLTVYLKLDGALISEANFEGKGCALCLASASLMTGAVRDRDKADAERLAGEVQKLCTTEGYESEELEALQPLAGVSRFPVRVKCATLPWHTLKAALAGEREATTE